MRYGRTKANVMRLLEQHKIPCKAHEYPHGKDVVDGLTVAALPGEDPARQAGTIIMCLSCRWCGAEPEKGGEAVDEKSVEMIRVKEILSLIAVSEREELTSKPFRSIV